MAGSLPFGLWLVRVTKGDDIRRVGSGNIGATNVWRLYGLRYGLPVVVLDIAKGFVAALAGAAVAGDVVGLLAGGAAMIGHWRPVFMRFARGGKTVATAGGVFFGLAPWVGLAALGLWIVIFLAARYASVASMLGALSLPVLAALFGESWPVIVFACIAAAAVLVLHRPNMRRLLNGTESRFELRRRGKVPTRAADPGVRRPASP